MGGLTNAINYSIVWRKVARKAEPGSKFRHPMCQSAKRPSGRGDLHFGFALAAFAFIFHAGAFYSGPGPGVQGALAEGGPGSWAVGFGTSTTGLLWLDTLVSWGILPLSAT